MALDRPLVRRFAHDFCVLPASVLARSSVHRFFRRASVLWGCYGIANAALGLWLLTAQTASNYVLLRTPLSILGTAAMVAVSTVWFRRVVERDDALAEPARRGDRAGT